MQQIFFEHVLLQKDEIFVTDFANSISLTVGIPATHMPYSIYEYMQDYFF